MKKDKLKTNSEEVLVDITTDEINENENAQNLEENPTKKIQSSAYYCNYMHSCGSFEHRRMAAFEQRQ